MNSEFSLRKQFLGFLSTPEIFAGNSLFDTLDFHTNEKHLAEEALQSLQQPDTFVLGKRMEYFFKFYIQHFSPFEIVLHNRQVISDKKTIGELDFLLKNRLSNEIVHVELVYKFYLYDPDAGTSEIEHYIGPNRRDTLIRKLERLQKHQFPLLFDAATAAIIPANIDISAVVQKMCFKAHVFLPKQTPAPNFSEINPAAVAGTWIRASDFTPETYEKYLFYVPKKAFWPVAPHYNSKWFTYSEIIRVIEPLLGRKYSPLVWVKSPAGTLERLFVVWW